MRVHDDILNCVAFLVVQTQDGAMHFVGTGFFMGTMTNAYSYDDRAMMGLGFEDSPHYYFVTARHCVIQAVEAGTRKLFVRLNTTKGGTEFVDVASGWVFSDKADIAIIPLHLSTATYAFLPISDRIAADDAVVEANKIGVSDDIAVVGLFSGHTGEHRNLPIVRVGTIAAMPNEPVEDEAGDAYPSYLIESRSTLGLSGSPVFAVLEPGRVITEGVTGINDPARQRIARHRTIHLIGVLRGLWQIAELRLPFAITEPELQGINSGISVVTPIQEVAALLDRDDLKKLRRETDRKRFGSNKGRREVRR